MLEKRIKLPKLHHVPTLDDIRRVHQGIYSYIHETPVLSSSGINATLEADLYFKCENLQKVGAFKIRGAMSAALSLTDEELACGLTTHSSGNHAQGVALAARRLDVPAYIVMPYGSSKTKVAATKDYGAEILHCAATVQAREAAVQDVIAQKQAAYIHPYNDYHVIAGQGTTALEFLQQCPDLDILLAPVSGGGLLSGVAIAAKGLSPNIQVMGTEPQGADDAYRSFHSKRLETNQNPQTICDGLRAQLGDKTLPIILEYVDDIITVSEGAILLAMRWVWERMKIIIEPSSAVPLAAVMEHPARFRGQRVGIIITGGNVDLEKIPFLE